MSGRDIPTGERAVRFVDERLGAAAMLKQTLRYVFPGHWSFMLGEIALYAFFVLIGTGIFMALFFEPSHQQVIYEGSYAPLRGQEMSAAYRSVLEQSFDVRAGLLMRQTHHWAANIFFASIVVHLARNFFTGAFRKPRELNWMLGVTILAVALPEALFGYAMIDDLLSGLGLAIAYAVGLSIPIIGASATVLFFGAEFPGSEELWPRLFILHTLVLPMLIAGLIGLHLFQVVRQHHTQFPGPGRTERNVVGTPMWPGYALRSGGLLAITTAVLFGLGGLVQVNPVWEWGPYHPYQSFNGAQPDWYLGWLIGALRLMPAFEPRLFGYTLAGNPFFGGALFPGIVFTLLYAWPWLEQRFLTHDTERHELLDRPRDNPTRTAIGAGFLTWVVIAFAVGSFDRIAFRLWIGYEGQIWVWRVLWFVLPVLVYLVTKRVCRDLQHSEGHPLRGWSGSRVMRTATGGFTRVPRREPDEEQPAAAVGTSEPDD